MKFIKELRKILGSNYVISFIKSERRFSRIRVGDLLNVDVSVLKKCYKCNNCEKGKCYLNLETEINHTEDLILVCTDCDNKSKLGDLLEYEEWLNEKN